MFSRNLEVLKLRRDLTELGKKVDDIKGRVDSLHNKLFSYYPMDYWGISTRKVIGMLDQIGDRIDALEKKQLDAK